MKKQFKLNLLAIYNNAIDNNAIDNKRMDEETVRTLIESMYGVVFINFDDDAQRFTSIMERSEVAQHTSNTVSRLAKEFSIKLKADLTKEQFNDCIKHKNAGRAHDYIDANMTMDAAFQKVVGRQFVFFDDTRPWTEQQCRYDADLLNAAWAMAHKHKFYTK